MTSLTAVKPTAHIAHRLPTVDIVIPVRNEEACLEQSVRTVHAALRRATAFRARIVIADNGSDDATPCIARRLSCELPGVLLLRLAVPGRGRALRHAWSASTADIVAYMDVDLSTDLDHLPELIAMITRGGADVAIGSRLAPGSDVRRTLRREVISRGYNTIVRNALHVPFRDAQCGFKALRADVARRLLAQVHDDGWFFDTELLVAAVRGGYSVRELPVRWVEDPTSTVRIARTALDDLRGIARLRRESHARRPLLEQLGRFAAIGVTSTAAYVLLFDLLRVGIAAQAANATALAVTAVANTLANRRYTFGERGTTHRMRTLLVGMITFVCGLALTSGSLATLDAIVARPATVIVDAVIVVTSVAATVLRFSLLRALLAPSQRTAARPALRG